MDDEKERVLSMILFEGKLVLVEPKTNEELYKRYD